MEFKKNRLKMENIEAEEEKFPTSQIIEEDSSAYYLPPRRSNVSIILWTLFILLLITVIGAGVYYQTEKGKKFFQGLFPQLAKSEETPKKKELADSTEKLNRIVEQPYIPRSSMDPELSACINFYRDRQVGKAMVKCEEYLNRPASDSNKSVALTILGVMYDEKGRTSLAIDKLKLAIKYDANNVHAYYNLAMAYRNSGNFGEAKLIILKAKEIAPGDSKISLLAGNILSETNDPEKAIDSYKEGISRSPNDPFLSYNLALSLYKQGKAPEAIENFQKAILAAGRGQVAELSHAHLGSIYYHRGELEAAEHHFREANSLRPNNAKYLYNLGIILLRKNKKEEAVAIFEKALKAGSRDPKIYQYIAESFEDLKLHDVAIDSLKQALKMKPDDVDTMFQLADMYYSRGNLTEAEDMFRRIVRATPGDTYTETALINLGIILDELERHEEAISSLEKAIDLNPKNPNAYYNLGIAYKNSGKPTKAIEQWRKASAIEPENARNLEAIGDYYNSNGYYLEASREYEDILKKNLNNYRVKLKLSDVYYHLKSFELAEKHLYEVLNFSKNGEEIKQAHRKLALVYAAGGRKNISKAKDEAYRAAHIDPDDMESKLILARILIDTNSLVDREKAIDELTAIVRSDVKPGVAARAYNYLGLCYYKNGEFRKALREFQNAIDLDPSLTEAYDNKRAARASYEDSLQETGL